MDCLESGEDGHGSEGPFKADADICQQLMSRYSASAAPQHRHLIATAAALRSVLLAESRELTPSAYFSVAVENLSGRLETLDSTAVAALLSLVAVVTPLVPENGISENSARKAVSALINVTCGENAGLNIGVGGVRGVVKCITVLILRFIHVDSWEAFRIGFEALIKFSLDTRHKVRRSGQECMESVFKAIELSSVRKEASLLVMSFLSRREVVATTLSNISVKNGCKEETLSIPEHLELLYLLNLVKVVVSYLSSKVSSRIFSQVIELVRPRFSALSRNLLKVIEAFFKAPNPKVIDSHMEEIVDCCCSFLRVLENPTDAMASSLGILRCALCKLAAHGQGLPKTKFSVICSCLIDIVRFSGEDVALTASETMIEFLNKYLNVGASGDAMLKEQVGILSITLDNALISCKGVLNKHLLRVISAMFLNLREQSCIFLKNIFLQLAASQKVKEYNTPGLDELERCIGSAIVAMGPGPILEYFPITFQHDDYTCFNFWLIPILKEYVVGASLKYYIDHFIPLAKSLQKAYRKGQKNRVGENLQAHAHDIFELLCSFCRYPNNMHKDIEALSDCFIQLLRKKSFRLQYITVALETLINQNRCILEPVKRNGDLKFIDSDSSFEWEGSFEYSKEVASKNLTALASCSPKLLQVLAELYAVSSLENRSYIKGAIECLSSITDSLFTRKILISLCERFNIMVDKRQAIEHNEPNLGVASDGQDNDLGSDVNSGEVQGISTLQEKDGHRHAIMTLTSCLVKGASNDLVGLLYDIVTNVFQANEVTYHSEAYNTLSKILEEHTLFCSAKIPELISLVMGVKRSSQYESLKERFHCLRMLMMYLLKITQEDGEKMAFLVLNEIIVTLKDKIDDSRKLSYDSLLWINSQMKNGSVVDSDVLLSKLVYMILAYLSSSSPHMKSGAVSALSVLVYDDIEICAKVSDLVPTMLSLLQSKSVEIVKAVLGFMKVLASCMEVQYLLSSLPDIMKGVLPWSSVSRHHFRSKVTVIIEIFARKCGSPAVESATPNQYTNFVKSVLQNRHHRPLGGKDSSRMEDEQASSLPPETDATQRKRKGGKPKDDSFGSIGKRHRPVSGGAFEKGSKRAKLSGGAFVKGSKRAKFSDGAFEKGSERAKLSGGAFEKGSKRAKYGKYGEGKTGESRYDGPTNNYRKRGIPKGTKAGPKKFDKKDAVSMPTRSVFLAKKSKRINRPS